MRTVVRSQTKVDQIRKDFPGYSNSQLDFALVPGITAPGAYKTAVVSMPLFDTVIHAASPFMFRVVNDNSEFLVPALNRSKEILKAMKVHMPQAF